MRHTRKHVETATGGQHNSYIYTRVPLTPHLLELLVANGAKFKVVFRSILHTTLFPPPSAPPTRCAARAPCAVDYNSARSCALQIITKGSRSDQLGGRGGINILNRWARGFYRLFSLVERQGFFRGSSKAGHTHITHFRLALPLCYSMALLGRSKPVHLRGSGREDEDAVFAAEDAKRQRAISPSSPSLGSAAVCISPVGESIYTLSSPWMALPGPKDSNALASREKGGGRALCFEEEGQGQEAAEEDQVRKR